MKNSKVRVLIVVALIVVAAIVVTLQTNHAAEEYGDGTCTECENGHFHLVSAPNKFHKFYTYECDTCGHVIEAMTRLN